MYEWGYFLKFVAQLLIVFAVVIFMVVVLGATIQQFRKKDK